MTTPPPRPPPPGFEPIARVTPFRALVGPLYVRRDATGVACGMYVDQKHENVVGLLHGGMVATLADVALSFSIGETTDPPLVLATISLSVDYADTAAPGDWIEARCDVLRVGRKVAFANCFIWCGDTRIARANGAFAVRSPGSRPKE